MKAKVKETGEIIEVHSLYPVTYSRLDCNGKIFEEYDYDELEFEPRPKKVSLDEVCEWLKNNMAHDGEYFILLGRSEVALNENYINRLRKEFGE